MQPGPGKAVNMAEAAKGKPTTLGEKRLYAEWLRRRQRHPTLTIDRFCQTVTEDFDKALRRDPTLTKERFFTSTFSEQGDDQRERVRQFAEDRRYIFAANGKTPQDVVNEFDMQRIHRSGLCANEFQRNCVG